MDPIELGTRLRAARLQARMSLRSVAEAVGVSASMLSQVERGKTHPSVSTLYALVGQLDVSLDDLLQASPRSIQPADPWTVPRQPADEFRLQRAGDNPVLNMENGIQWERLASPAGGDYTSILVTYEPGASSSIEGRLMRHHGSEHALLLEGELTLQVEFDVHTLGAGDSMILNSLRPHMYVNRTNARARGVWFVSDRNAPDATPAPSKDLLDSAVAHFGPPRDAVDVLRAFEAISPNEGRAKTV